MAAVPGQQVLAPINSGDGDVSRIVGRFPEAQTSAPMRSVRMRALFNSRHYPELLNDTANVKLEAPLALLRARASWRAGKPQDFPVRNSLTYFTRKFTFVPERAEGGTMAVVESPVQDSYWNAAMREMRQTGYMHNYMRMYWGKKILEWSRSPESAFATALTLNNKYFLDGRDPNSFANVAWIFGQHDRPWVERPVFGQVRYMNDKGLERKFDIGAYVRWTEGLEPR